MDDIAQQLGEKINISTSIGNIGSVDSVVQQLAQKINMSFDEFAGEMRKRSCSEPTAIKIWRGEYENYKNFKDNDISLSNLRKAADVLKVGIGRLFPKAFTKSSGSEDLLVANQDYILMMPKDAGHSDP
jgi:transcriptional regulator with XRE-family HTH domain